MALQRELIYGVHSIFDERNVEHLLLYGLLPDFVNNLGEFEDEGRLTKIKKVRYELESNDVANEIEREEISPFEARVPGTLEFSWEDVMRLGRHDKIKMKISYESGD